VLFQARLTYGSHALDSSSEGRARQDDLSLVVLDSYEIEYILSTFCDSAETVRVSISSWSEV
jgi:hypothetical protein